MLHISQCDVMGSTKVVSQITMFGDTTERRVKMYKSYVCTHVVFYTFQTFHVTPKNGLESKSKISSVLYVVPTTKFSRALHEKMVREKFPWHVEWQDRKESTPLKARRDGIERDGNFPSRIVSYCPVSSLAVPSHPVPSSRRRINGSRYSRAGPSHCHGKKNTILRESRPALFCRYGRCQQSTPKQPRRGQFLVQPIPSIHCTIDSMY